MRCSNCGNENPPQYSFCLNCGSRLDEETTIAVVRPPEPTPALVRNKATSYRNAKSYWKWLVVFLVASAFFSLFVVAEYFYQKSKALEEQQASQVPQSPRFTATNTPTPEPLPSKQVSTPTPLPTPSLEKTPPATIEADPSLFPPQANIRRDDRNTNANSDEASSSPENYSRTFRPGEVTQKARILSRPEPQYTEEARKNQISGTVVLKAVFASNGMVTNIIPVSQLPFGLTEKAIDAARQIRFVPAQKDGHAVSQHIQIEYSFNLY